MKNLTAVLACLCAPVISASATVLFTPVEFVGSSTVTNNAGSGSNQSGFQVWAGDALNNTVNPNTATWDIATTGTSSGTTTVVVSSTSRVDTNGNIGTFTGTPAGFTYENLYKDFIYAWGASDALTLSFSGLDANTKYNFTLYSYAGNGTALVDEKVWTISGGTSTPTSDSVIYSTAIADNNTFAMEFEVTTSALGTFAVANTAGQQNAALNGFALATIPEPSAYAVIFGLLGFALGVSRRRR